MLRFFGVIIRSSLIIRRDIFLQAPNDGFYFQGLDVQRSFRAHCGLLRAINNLCLGDYFIIHLHYRQGKESKLLLVPPYVVLILLSRS